MKIAILVSMFPPKWLGGAEVATQNIAKCLVRKGNEVHILTSRDEGLPKESKEEGFFVHRIFYPKIRILGVILFWIKSLLYLKKINPEIIHSQGIQMAVPCFLAKKFLKKSYVVYCQGFDIYLPWKFKRLISNSILKNAKVVIALTENMRSKVQEIYNREVFIIPNGIEPKRFGNLSKEAMRNKLGTKKEEKNILFVGTLKSVKGVKYLIEAVGIVKEKVPEIKLLLVGDGGERKNLEKLVEELNLENYVTFIGKIPNEEVPKYMMISDVFVLPSLSEGLPITILEAMASGLPIVATKVGGLPEIVRERENGFLVEPKNSKEIAEKVLYLLSNDKIRNSISLNNKEKAKNYSWDSIVDKLTKVYSLCKNKR